MMSALSDVFERSSQERTSGERSSVERPRQSNDSGMTAPSSASDHGYELQEVRIIAPPLDEIEHLPRAASSSLREAESEDIVRAALFQEYRDRIERVQRPRGPASSSQAARSAFANAPAPINPRDSNELRRSGRLKSAMRPSMEQSMNSAQSIPMGEDPGAFVVQATLDKAARDNAERKSFQAPRLGGSIDNRLSSIPHRVRVSFDQPTANGASAINSVGATLVRRRRRLPWKLLLAFGIVSCLCLVVALTTLSIGIYNFTKLRAARAARTIDQLRDEIEPQIKEILSILRNSTRL